MLLAARSKSVAIGGRSEHFALYVLNGIVLWTFFASGTAKGLTSVVTRGDLIDSVTFPRERARTAPRARGRTRPSTPARTRGPAYDVSLPCPHRSVRLPLTRPRNPLSPTALGITFSLRVNSLA